MLSGEWTAAKTWQRAALFFFRVLSMTWKKALSGIWPERTVF